MICAHDTTHGVAGGNVDTVRYVRVYADATGVSRFEDGDFTLAAMNFAPPAPPVAVSAPLPASAVMVLKVRAGWTDPAHPAPARQFMFILSGQIEVEDRGEVRRFSAGDIVLAEDTQGPGHATTSLEDTVIANVRV